MATTYTLISSNTLSGSAASVTFSSIPSTYTDLVLRISARSDETGNIQSQVNITFNASTAANYSATRLLGSGTTASSTNYSSENSIRASIAASSSATANTFSNTEIYIPNYTVSQNKPQGTFSVSENNATSADKVAVASLWRSTATISSIELSLSNGSYNFLTGSTFYLYGIKNS